MNDMPLSWPHEIPTTFQLSHNSIRLCFYLYSAWSSLINLLMFCLYISDFKIFWLGYHRIYFEIASKHSSDTKDSEFFCFFLHFEKPMFLREISYFIRANQDWMRRELLKNWIIWIIAESFNFPLLNSVQKIYKDSIFIEANNHIKAKWVYFYIAYAAFVI